MKIVCSFLTGVLVFVAVSATFRVANAAAGIVPCTDWSCSGPRAPGAVGLCVDLANPDPNKPKRCGCQAVPGEFPVRMYCRILWAMDVEDTVENVVD